jgi:uncharacterized protein (TIGR02246 family)
VENPYLVIPLAALALGCASSALREESVEAAIRARVKQYEVAYNAGDADAVAAIYAVDGTHTYALGFTHHGRLEIANGLKEQFAGPLNGTRIAISPLRIRALSPTIGIEEASFVLTGFKDPAGSNRPPISGLCLGMYQNTGGQWFAVAVQCLVPPPTQ